MAQNLYPQLVDVVCTVPAPCESKTPFEQSYDRVRAEIMAVPDLALTNINVDIPSAIATVLANATTIAGLRDTIAQDLPSTDLTRFDRLLDYAQALAYLQTDYMHVEATVKALPGMYEEALKFRETVLSVGKVLTKLQLIESSVFEEAGSVQGHRNVGYELGNLCMRLLERYPSIAGRSALTEEQLVRGKTLASKLLTTAAERDASRVRSGVVAKERHRAYTLLAGAYNEVRRAVVYLRWNEGDADTLAPSFYAGRGSGKKSDKPDAGATDAPEAVSASVSVGTGAASSSATQAALGGAAASSFGAGTLGAASASAGASEPKRDSMFMPAPEEPFIQG